ncbi:ATP-dependent helicase/nuclease subunit A [Ruminiclostridium hungatei]|uniref:ATP-dependent helicase/nuclease subunit A n=1 Tax=Ruminiclostridium hungatei TaxID=48256 RepID=A0A1V4SFW7_RUMHU|nr:helicase-exonuclease AddAB subunit AddA [Ruminiclostridium hungatei]OPX42633.1 ATP-dependent helicase/nuclease subunit A [Ruminiclostridium hungatei]
MAQTVWTKEQQAAIMEKDCNLLVAAAAGAGKTAVLVERIIRKIINEDKPVDIDALLVVTFTNAAATEMRERIGTAISKAIEEKSVSKSLQRQLTLLNKASITTIHSFCLEVIRNNFQSLELDPNFRILDETEAAIMRLETLNELFEEVYEDQDNNSDFFDLLEAYGTNRDDQKLQDMVLNIYGFVQSYPWPEKWLSDRTEDFNGDLGKDFSETSWGEIVLKITGLRLEGLIEIYAGACKRLKHASGLEKYFGVFQEELDRLKELLRLVKGADPAMSEETGNKVQATAKWNDIFLYLNNFEFIRLPSSGKDADKQLQEQVRQTRDETKAFVKNLKEEVFFQKSEDITADLKEVYPLLKCLSRLVLEFTRKYSDRKHSKAAVDFNDLEHFCLKLLAETDEAGNNRPSAVAMAYKDKFDEILVDEYQDSNLVQEIIIGMISREDRGTPNVFMVGDVKQSIYRFRQAKPELFMGKYNSYSGEAEGLYRKLLLFKNFRSRKEVVDGVNFIFEQIMSESMGELEYDQQERLNPGAFFPEPEEEAALTGGTVELHLLETAASSSPEEEQEEAEEEPAEGEEEEILDNLQKEARLVAGRIIELMQPDSEGRYFCVFDKKENQYRKLQFRDIVILLRTTKSWTEVFCEELSLFGIPVFADTGSGFFKTPEVQVFLSLLQIIDNPYQDIPLLSVLRSPVANFSTDELAELRLTDRKAALFDALKLLAESDGKTGQKAGGFLKRLEQWRSMSMYMSTHKLIWQLYGDTGYFSIVGAMQDGERKQANLRVLFERALQYEKTSYKGLFNFINFIDRLKTGKGDMGSAKILGENDNVVRLMSIHKSKGLEFPVVFVSGCGKKFNFQDMYKSILLHQELGFGPDFVDYRRRIKYPSVPKLAIAQKIRNETLSEEMRILYVALTRAREKLILTGAVGNLEKAASKWLSAAEFPGVKFPPDEMAKARNYLDWICPAVMRHENALNLRFAAGTGRDAQPPEVPSDSKWSVYLKNSDYSISVKKAGSLEQNEFNVMDVLRDKNTDKKTRAEISRRLSWKYPFPTYAGIPSKLSVTELKRYFSLNDEGQDYDFSKLSGIRKPSFLQEKKGLSAAEKGTVLHFVMQHLDFASRDIESQLRMLVSKELITQQQSESVDVRKLMAFVNADICKRILAADAVYREIPFNLELSFKELYENHQELPFQDRPEEQEETVLLQGVIDCYFEEQGNLVLLDYKTDYVESGGTERIKDRYRLQLEYYSRALEKLTGLKVSERYVYLFATGELAGL